jgi:hypothetical protein
MFNVKFIVKLSTLLMDAMNKTLVCVKSKDMSLMCNHNNP